MTKRVTDIFEISSLTSVERTALGFNDRLCLRDFNKLMTGSPNGNRRLASLLGRSDEWGQTRGRPWITKQGALTLALHFSEQDEANQLLRDTGFVKSESSDLRSEYQV